MFNLNKEIKQWKKTLRKNRSFEEGYVEELASHLLDKIDELKIQGYSEQEAFQKALEDLGDPGDIGNQYMGVNKIGKSIHNLDIPFVPELIINYIKIAARNFQKDKGYFAINVLGISLGLALFILISMFVNYHYSFNKFHKNYENISVLVNKTISTNGTENHSALLETEVRDLVDNKYDDITSTLRWIPVSKKIVRFGNDKYFESGIRVVDENLFDFFDFKLVKGDYKKVLSDPDNVVISESIAQKYFGDKNPIGQTLLFDGNKSFEVSGVVEDCPQNSGLTYKIFLPYNSFSELEKRSHKTAIFVLKKSGINISEKSDVIEGLQNYSQRDNQTNQAEFYFYPFEKLYMNSTHIDGVWFITDESAFYVLLFIGVLLLLVMSINFVNLATARYDKRAKEVGLRKVVGAEQKQIITQFLAEAMFLAISAYPIALLISHSVTPGFNTVMSSGNMILQLSIFDDIYLLMMLFGLTIIIGFLSGIYPAFYISKLKPVEIFKEKMKSKSKGRLRKILVISQFVFTLFLICFSIVMRGHFDFLSGVDLGYSRENVSAVLLDENLDWDRVTNFKNEIQALSSVKKVTSAGYYPVMWHSKTDLKINVGSEEKDRVDYYSADYNFAEVFELELIEGRTPELELNDDGNFLINQSAISKLNIDDPIGKEIIVNEKTGKVIGIVKDFHFKNLNFPIRPAVISVTKNNGYIFIKFDGKQNLKSNQIIESVWQKHFPDQPFEINTVEKQFSIAYAPLENYSLMIGFMSLIAIVFSCLGVFALSSFTIQKRIKEIGIRKVLGSKNSEIVLMLLKNFLKPVLISNIISLPLSYYFITEFLAIGWTYQRDLELIIFIAAGALSFVCSITAVIFQVVRASRVNPAILLKYE